MEKADYDCVRWAVRLIDAAEEAFGFRRQAAMMMLGSSGCLSAESNVLKQEV